VSFRNGKAHAHTPDKTVNFEVLVRMTAAAARPERWPLRARYSVRLDVFLAHERGDMDNHLKSLGDGCNGVLWHDDSVRYVRDAELHVESDPAQPRLEVTVIARPVPCELSGCGHRETYYPDDKGRCEECSAKAAARPARARGSA
jgi:Holliday junction resolvase RusA-like endonuclease